VSLSSRILAIASQTFPRTSSRVLASSGYTLDLGRFGPDAYTVWTAETAARQDRAWQPIIAAAKAGRPREDVAALEQALDLLAPDARVLEVGCGGGYNSEIIDFHAPRMSYVGLDIAPAMIDIAREHYPGRSFVVGSSYELPEKSGSFEVVIDGVALIHMSDWQKAIAEYARVARSGVVLHGITLTDRPTVTFAKYAYGQPSRELAFNTDELRTACEDHGLHLRSVLGGLDYDLEAYLGIPTTSVTWVLDR
jgi:ubiquinone/menaquinone biosynthesis C-methylase UbiE